MPNKAAEYWIYAVAVILSLIAVTLVLLAPPDLLNVRVVYQGF